MAFNSRVTTSDSLYASDDKFIVVLDSRNATKVLNGSMNSCVTFDFEEPIQTTRDVLKFTCSVMSFTAPNSIYNVTSLNNRLDLLYINEADTYFLSLLIPTGNYNATTFMTKLRLKQNKTKSGEMHTGGFFRPVFVRRAGPLFWLVGGRCVESDIVRYECIQ